MAEVHKTRDPNIWFNPDNFRDVPGERALTALTALEPNQTVSLLLNGTRTRWARFAGGAPALKASDAIAKQVWNAILPGSWVTLVIIQDAAAGRALVGSRAVGQDEDPPIPSTSLPAAPGAQSITDTSATLPRHDRLFDVYLFIDWSATNSRAINPGPDQLWLAEQVAGSQPIEKWFPMRWDCTRYIEQRLLHHVGLGRRVLVGFDFPYGYPSGLVDAACLPAPAGKWLAVWTALSSLLSDDEENRSNRFEVAAALNAMMTPGGGAPGPFWNTPAPGSMLTANAPPFPFAARNGVNLSQWRTADQRFKQAGLQPQSAFKLYTRGSVGSQSLTGIRST